MRLRSLAAYIAGRRDTVAGEMFNLRLNSSAILSTGRRVASARNSDTRLKSLVIFIAGRRARAAMDSDLCSTSSECMIVSVIACTIEPQNG